MSAAEDAFRAVEVAIAGAMRREATALKLSGDIFHSLEMLPPGLAELKHLQRLILDETQISDLAPLAGLTALEHLSLDNTLVSDLAPLAGVMDFDAIEAFGDIPSLEGLQKLTVLRLNQTRVSDITPIGHLKGLEILWLDDTQVFDLAALSGLANLKELWVGNTQVRDLSPLAGLDMFEALGLDKTLVSDLAPLAGLTKLKVLLLNNIEVRDLAPLRELTGLQSLRLDNTQVLDLRPLIRLRKLADEPNYRGLTFTNIPATADPKIAEIAEIEDAATRAKALFELLDAGWEPPAAVEPVPLEPDPLLRSILIDGKLEIAPDPPTEEERRDQVKAVLHERLKEKARDLSVLAGNRFPRLANRARALMTLLDRPFDELDLLSVHLEIEDLEDRRATGTEDGEPYTDDVQNAVADVTRAGPGLTVGHPDVDTFLDRRRRSREDVVQERDDAAHRRLSQAVIDDAAANGPNSRALEGLSLNISDLDSARVLQVSKHQNLLWKLTTIAGSATSRVGRDVGVAVVSGLIISAYGPAITSFVSTNYGLLSEVAATYGQGVLLWFQQTVGPLMAGIDTTVIRPLERPKREKR